MTDDACPSCGSRDIRLHDGRGELVCETCGLVLEDNLISSRPRAQLPDRPAEGQNTTRPDLVDRGLSSKIGGGNRDGKGAPIPTRNHDQVYRLKRAQGLAHTSFERGLATAFRRIHSLADILEVDRAVVDTACVLYRRWATIKGHGRQVRTYAAAALFAACRQHGVHRPRAAFVTYCTFGDKALRSAYWDIIHVTRTAIEPLEPAAFMAEMAHVLGASPEAQGRALELVHLVQQERLCTTCRPQSIAAACLFLETLREQPNLMQVTVAKKCGISENTLHKVCVEVLNHLVALGRSLPPIPSRLAEAARLERERNSTSRP